jgi:5-methylcytosine-specific restriction endonuclease McrA
MPFFMVDDQLHVNRKVNTLAEAALENDLLGIAALGLWTAAGSACQAMLSDGVISVNGLVKILLNKEAVDLLAARLVEVGLWHAHGHDCERCPAVPAKHFLFHDWKSLGYESGASIRLKRDKAKELKDPALRAAVWARDCTDFPKATVGKCRYCRKTVYRATQKGDDRPEMDHIDPTKACGASNVVLSCAKCNREKGQRNPGQAGMTLHPAPTRAAVSASVEPSSPSVAAERAPEASIAHNVVEPVQDVSSRFNLRVPSPDDAPVPVPEQPRPAPPQIEIPIESDPEPRSNPINEEKAIYGHAHAGARGGRAGQGRDGLSNGFSTGKPAPSSTSPSKSRRRKRGSRPSPVSTGASVGSDSVSTDVPDGGPAPAVPHPGRFGSPYYGVQGKQEEVPESICQIHGQHMPCRRCQDESERSTRA